MEDVHSAQTHKTCMANCCAVVVLFSTTVARRGAPGWRAALDADPELDSRGNVKLDCAYRVALTTIVSPTSHVPVCAAHAFLLLQVQRNDPLPLFSLSVSLTSSPFSVCSNGLLAPLQGFVLDASHAAASADPPTNLPTDRPIEPSRLPALRRTHALAVYIVTVLRPFKLVAALKAAGEPVFHLPLEAPQQESQISPKYQSNPLKNYPSVRPTISPLPFAHLSVKSQIGDFLGENTQIFTKAELERHGGGLAGKQAGCRGRASNRAAESDRESFPVSFMQRAMWVKIH